jgi:hypothetical protein
MEKHWKDLDKNCISIYQKLTEPFMEKHWKDLYKGCISKYQKLTESFIEKYKDELYLNEIPRKNIIKKTTVDLIKEIEVKALKILKQM